MELNNKFIEEMSKQINNCKKLKTLDISYNRIDKGPILYSFLTTLWYNKTLKGLTCR